jgi:hypothetical protein
MKWIDRLAYATAITAGLIFVIVMGMILMGCEDDTVVVEVPIEYVEVPVDREVPVIQHVQVDIALTCGMTSYWSMRTGEPVVIHVSDTLCVPPRFVTDTFFVTDTVVVTNIVRDTVHVTDTLRCVLDGGKLYCS